MADSWEKYCVGIPRVGAGFNADCQSFASLTHTTHIRYAIDILRDGVMRPRLVFDKSILNDKRILINWVSPNHWNPGYRYGNIAFRFDLKTIIENADIYWVEDITTYSPTAVRYLVSSQNRTTHGGLAKIDLTKKAGPWWLDPSTGTHYFNGKFCLEIMVERELLLSNVTAIECVDHHPQWCSVTPQNPQSCKELGIEAVEGADRFLCGIPFLSPAQGPSLWIMMDAHFRNRAWARVRDAAKQLNPSGAAVANSAAGRASAKAAMIARHLADDSGFQDSIAVFANSNECSSALATLFEQTYGLTAGTLPR